MRPRTTLLAAAAALLVSAPHAYPADSQTGGRTAGEQATQEEMDERKEDVVRGSSATIDNATFVRKAAENSAAEVELADLALRRAQSDAVRSFAEHMKKDHSAAQAELAKVAEGAGVEMPKILDDDHKSLEEQLAKLQGEEFDEAYMSEMVRGHEKEIVLFTAKARASDGDLAAYAQKMVPVLDRHLTMARSVSQTLATIEGMEQRQGDAAQGDPRSAGSAH